MNLKTKGRKNERRERKTKIKGERNMYYESRFERLHFERLNVPTKKTEKRKNKSYLTLKKKDLSNLK